MATHLAFLQAYLTTVTLLTHQPTVFENHRIVSFYIASEASKVDKSSLKMPKMVNLASFLKPEAVIRCYQIGQFL